MSTLASFAPVAAAALLSPSGGGPGSYSCDEHTRWGSYFQASATTSFEAGYEDQRRTRLQVTWAESPAHAANVSVSWSSLLPDVESLPPPDELSFGITTRPLRGGTILLIPKEGELIQLRVKKPAVRNLKNMGTSWVRIEDPAQRARLIEGGGWRFAVIGANGKMTAQGPIHLPDRAGMQIRYRPMAETLRAKAAAYETACQFEPQTEWR